MVDTSDITMASISIPPTLLTLKDGTEVNLCGGDSLPKDLPTAFQVIVVPHLFLARVAKDVFIETSLRGMRRSIRRCRRDDRDKTRHVLRKAKAEVDKVVDAGLDDLHMRVKAGVLEAQETWTEFCDDCVIVAICLASLGRRISVLAHEPVVMSGKYAGGLLFKI